MGAGLTWSRDMMSESAMSDLGKKHDIIISRPKKHLIEGEKADLWPPLSSVKLCFHT
jgi:hypothetical protein